MLCILHHVYIAFSTTISGIIQLIINAAKQITKYSYNIVLKATEWMQPNDDYRYDAQPSQRPTDFICQPGPAMHIDLLNRERLRYPMVLLIHLSVFSCILSFALNLQSYAQFCSKVKRSRVTIALKCVANIDKYFLYC